MSSTFYDDLDVESVLSCPVCFEVPSNVIYLCKVGHHMCEKCRKKLTLCPTCQSALTGTRNFLAESLISKFSVLKINDNAVTADTHPEHTGGTPLKLEHNTEPLRVQLTPPGKFRCLLESCPHRPLLGVGTLYKHLGKAHKHLYEKFPNKTATFEHDFANFCLVRKGEQKYHRAFHVTNMGLFYLVLTVLEDRHLNCWLSMAAPVRTANRFAYQLTFTPDQTQSSGTKHTFVSQVASNLNDRHWLMERGRVFVLSPSQHSLDRKDFFSMQVKIVYRYPKGTAKSM